MTDNMSDTLSAQKAPFQKAPDCPFWCVAQHRYDFDFDTTRTHYGYTQSLRGVDFGEETVAQVELVRMDNLATGVTSEVGVTAWCDGTLTVEQTLRFAQMVLRAHALAKDVRDGVPFVVEGMRER